MKRVIIKHPKTTLLDIIVDAFGNIYKKEVFDDIYLEIIKLVIKGEYKIEFEDGIFQIDEKDIFKNLEKFQTNPNYNLELKKVTPKDILEYTNQTAPINLEKITKFFNINLVKNKTLKVDGISKYENDNYFIIYKSGELSNYRENFTIAHELGHIFLHFSNKHKFFTDELNSKLDNKQIAARGLKKELYHNFQLEREANNFAAELLMPKDEIIRLFDEFYYDIYKFANFMEVSYQAMEIRLKNLGLIPNY